MRQEDTQAAAASQAVSSEAAVGKSPNRAAMALEQLRHEITVIRSSQERLAAVRGLDNLLPARVATAIEWLRAATGKLEITAQLLDDEHAR